MRTRRIRALFDSEIFSLQRHGGVSRYYAELIRELPGVGVEPRLLAGVTINEHLELSSRGVLGYRLPKRLLRPEFYRFVRVSSRVLDQLVCRASKHDVLHQTYYGHRYPKELRRVVTVVDMIPELFQGAVSATAHTGKRQACREASLIFTISKNTKDDLVRLYPELNCPIEVTPLAVNTEFFQAHARGQEGRQILFVGGRRGYKDFATFARAASQLLAKDSDLVVRCVGGGPLLESELQPFVERGVADRCVSGVASDQELPSLYRGSLAFVFSSRYEGFGLPILEAFASGCPAIITRASCFPEVAGEAAEYFEPGNSDQLLEALERVCKDSVRRNELRRLGSKRLELFSWRRTAELTRQAYDGIVQA